MQRLDSRPFIAINKKINGFLRVSGMKNPGALPGFPLFSFYFYSTGWSITTMPTIFGREVVGGVGVRRILEGRGG
jgi:hypothetical protein